MSLMRSVQEDVMIMNLANPLIMIAKRMTATWETNKSMEMRLLLTRIQIFLLPTKYAAFVSIDVYKHFSVLCIQN